jgi:hypothetical protein
MLLRAMADLDEELALWSAPVAAPAPPPSSADGMLCEPLAPPRSLVPLARGANRTRFTRPPRRDACRRSA